SAFVRVSCDQTRRRLGGRHPLCGTGVTSRMRVTLKPTPWSARRALSRPAPGPFTKTATERTPCSIALRAASSAASCAAKGVLLREPLKPREPALDHATVLPFTSVMVTTGLLNVDWMCAIPVEMFFLAFFLADLVLPPAPPGPGGVLVFVWDMNAARCFLTGGGRNGSGDSKPYGGVLRARARTPLRGPLRGRAFVWVRCPLTGNPRRCRRPRE